MNPTTKLLFKALILEYVLAFISVFIGIIATGADSLSNFLAILFHLAIPILVGFLSSATIIYHIGAYIHLKRPSKNFCMVIGIFLMFVLLTISVLIGTFTLHILFENSIDHFSYLNVLLIFYVLGGVQTLFVGLWLGVKLNQLPR
ncbi:hypothetical protein [uncultured Capnocytophaga sp.]|uniref:hypothetical protein n=1 Tax=uncultured Capnocytophaga sp. TaxID=159273 RepID=UPI002618E79F|nr:hypothetical protein [uncultured Capnocytophaga sp.]